MASRDTSQIVNQRGAKIYGWFAVSGGAPRVMGSTGKRPAGAILFYRVC